MGGVNAKVLRYADFWMGAKVFRPRLILMLSILKNKGDIHGDAVF
jgi:hypothetical protein